MALTTRAAKLLLTTVAAASLLGSSALPAQATEVATASVATETYTQVLSAKVLLAGAENPSDIKRYGGCKVSAKHLACYAKPWVSKQVGYTPLRVSPILTVPAAVVRAAEPGTLRMQVTATFSKVSGAITWDYGADYETLRQGKIKRAGAHTLGTTSLTGTQVIDGKVRPWFDFGFAKGTKATFKSVKVRYTYELTAR